LCAVGKASGELPPGRLPEGFHGRGCDLAKAVANGRFVDSIRIRREPQADVADMQPLGNPVAIGMLPIIVIDVLIAVDDIRGDLGGSAFLNGKIPWLATAGPTELAPSRPPASGPGK
jgi:hypothetical protein